MTTAQPDDSVRACAARLIEIIADFKRDQDAPRLKNGLLLATRPLVRRSDLLSLGTKRMANHIDNSKYLYYDGELSMTLDEFPKGKLIPPHDHGIWEALVLCTGRLRHTSYLRADDGTVAGSGSSSPPRALWHASKRKRVRPARMSMRRCWASRASSSLSTSSRSATSALRVRS